MICIRPMAPLGDRARSITKTFRPHDGANPGRRNCEPLRCLGHEASRMRSAATATPWDSLDWFGVRDTDAAEQHDRGRTAQTKSPDNLQPACPSANGGRRYGRNGEGRSRVLVRRRVALCLKDLDMVSGPLWSRADRRGRRWSTLEAGRNSARRASSRTASSSGRPRGPRRAGSPASQAEIRPR